MASLKSLAKDTAIYGLSSIVGRFLNYLLVPLYTVKLAAESGGYGIITNLYAYAALLIVLLTFGMETSFFRFINKEEEKVVVASGIADFDSSTDTNLASVFEKADSEMYNNKKELKEQ